MNNHQTNLISVIVPNYNNERFLEDCLESIFRQKNVNIEVVIIDDASTDASREIIDRWAGQHSNIKKVYLQKNEGIATVRNIGVKNSSGEFITTLDSDDIFWNKNKLERELECLVNAENEDNKIIIAFSNTVLVDENLRFISNRGTKNTLKTGDLFKNIFARDCEIPRDYLIRKQHIIEAGGFDENIPIYEDWDLKIRLSRHSCFVYTNVQGTGYRQHATGLSRAPKDEHQAWIRYIFRKNAALLSREERKYVESALFHKRTINQSNIRKWINRLLRRK